MATATRTTERLDTLTASEFVEITISRVTFRGVVSYEVSFRDSEVDAEIGARTFPTITQAVAYAELAQ